MTRNHLFSPRRNESGATASTSTPPKPISTVKGGTSPQMPLDNPAEDSTKVIASGTPKAARCRRTLSISSVRQGIKRAFTISRPKSSFNQLEDISEVNEDGGAKKDSWWICCEPLNMYDDEGDKCHKRNYEPLTACYNCGHILCSSCEISLYHTQESKQRVAEEAMQQAINDHLSFGKTSLGGRLVDPELGFAGLTFEHGGDGRVSRLAKYQDDENVV